MTGFASSALVPPRSTRPELMDRPDNPVEALEEALSDLRLVNRWLGGRRTLLDAVRPYLLPGARLRILDVGTGGADLPLALVACGREAGADVEVVALDRDPRTAGLAARAVAHEPRVAIVCADALAPPFRAGSFDLVTASLFLHHVPSGDVVPVLATLARLAGRAVVINDLRRHRVAWALTWLFGRLTRRNPMFLVDGPLSVLRGFTPDELTSAAHAAGATAPIVRRRWPFRLALTLETGGRG